MNTSNILLRAISVTLLLVTLAACTKHDASYYIDLAKSAEQSGNVNEAVLHYKSAIGLEPQNTSYREALGLLYSKAGDLESAIKELELAAKTTPLSLALFYHLLENHYFLEADQRVVSLYKEHADSFQASEIFHATIIAIVANRRMGNLQFAKQLAEKLQTINRSVYQGLLAYIDNNYSEALAKLRENEDVMTQRVGTTLILAELASASADHRYSVTLYEKVTNAIPDFLPFQLFLANGYILIEQFDNAQPIITKLIKGYPNHPYINYLSSILKIKKNDLEGAKLAAEKAISYGFNTPQVKSIAGIANYFLGNYESAYKNLKYLTEEKGPKGFLYGVYLAASIELGYSEDALSNLSADGGGEETNKLTAFFAQQILQNRSLSLADQLIYERLSKPGAALNKQTAIAATVIGDSAMWPDLISFVNQHLEDEFLVQLFIAQQIRNQQFDTALDIAKRWQQTKPEALNANQTLSLTYALSGQPLQAIKQAEYTLVRFPNDLASTFLLHKVRASDAGYAEAKQAMEAVFAIEQLHVGAFRFLREKVTTIVEMRDFTTFLEGTLVKAGVTDSELNIMLFELKLALNQSQSVIDALALRDLSSMDDKYSIILAQAYVNLGKPEKSIELLKSKLTHSPGSSLLVSALLSVQATMQNYSAVFNTLDRRMQSVESDSQLLILKADYQIASGDVTAASASLASVKNPSPFQSAMIDMLNGKIAFKQGRYADAVKGLTKLYVSQKDAKSLAMLFWAYLYSGDQNQAYTLLENHTSIFPGDLSAISFAAEAYVGVDNAKAIEHYLSLHHFNAENPATLNNLAYLYRAEGDLDLALKYSSQAADYAPLNEDILDTHGVNLMMADKSEEGEKVLSKAFNISRRSDIGINLVQALYNNKKIKEADAIVKILSAKNDVQKQQITMLTERIKAAMK